MNGEHVSFSPGDIIFRQGESGGCFYIIQSGNVEVYQAQDKTEVSLAKLKKGEVLGLLTLLDEGPRFASARAIDQVECQKFRRSSALDDINLPKWVNVVIKEFSVRLKQSNQIISDLMKKSNEMDIGGKRIYTADIMLMAVQLANGLAELSSHYAETIDGSNQLVPMKTLIEALDEILSYGQEDLMKLLDVFQSTNLIQISNHPDKSYEVASLEDLKKIKWFSQYILKSVSGIERKQVAYAFPHRQRRCLVAIVDYMKRREFDISKLQTVSVQKLKDELKAVTGVAFEEDVLDPASKLKLLDLKGKSANLSISVNGSQLVRTLISIQTIHKLRNIELT